MNAENNPPVRSEIALAPRRWLILLSMAFVLLSAVAGGVYFSGRNRPVETTIPAIELGELDPVVRQVVISSQDEVRRSPRSAQAWGRLAMVLYVHNLGTTATDCFDHAARLDPGEPRWPYLQSLNLRWTEPERALEQLRLAVRLSGSDLVPRLRLADELLLRKELDEAEKHYREAAVAQPGHPWPRLGLGRVARERGDLRGSLEQLRKGVESGPKVKSIRVALAEVFQQLGELASAERERLVASNLPDGFAWPDQHLEAAEQLGVSAQAKASFANSLLAQGRLPEAADLLVEARRSHPDSAPLHHLLGVTLIQMKDEESAEESLRRSIELKADVAGPHFDLGVCLQKKGRLRAAAASYRRSLELMPSNALAAYNLAICLRQLNDAEGALAALRQVVRYKPDFAAGHRELGRQLAEKGRKEEALQHLEHAARLAPGDKVTETLMERVRKEGAAKRP